MTWEIASDYWMWFVVYSIAGWIWEMILFRFTEGKFVRRGFLYGPFCPIYGAGAVLFWTTLRWVPAVIRPVIPNLILSLFVEGAILFLLGGLMACVMEYYTSVILEHCFHTRWWDYFRNRFNIKGRVCLLGFTAFGAFAVGIIEILQPCVVWVTDLIWDPLMIILGVLTGAWMLVDFILTLIKVIRKRKQEDKTNQPQE